MANEFNPVVKLYYDGLFENLEFYLTDIAPGDDAHWELGSVDVQRQGLRMSAEVMSDQYPQLDELLSKTSITERYDYLLHRYANEYRTNMDKEVAERTGKAEESLGRLESHNKARPSSWDTIKSTGAAEQEWKGEKDLLERRYREDLKRVDDLVKYFRPEPVLSCDAEVFAKEEVEKYFPQLKDEQQRFREGEIEVFTELDPADLYERMVLSYSVEYVAEIGDKLKHAQKALDAAKRSLENHEGEKPDLLTNVRSFGDAVEKWETRRNEIVSHIDHVTKLAEWSGGLRSQLLEEGRMSPLAREKGVIPVQVLHPQLVEARNEVLARQWTALRQEQVESRESRADGHEVKPDQEQSPGMMR